MICQGIILFFTNSNKNLFFFIVGIPLCLLGYRINELVTSCRQTHKYIRLYIILYIQHVVVFNASDNQVVYPIKTYSLSMSDKFNC